MADGTSGLVEKVRTRARQAQGRDRRDRSSAASCRPASGWTRSRWRSGSPCRARPSARPSSSWRPWIWSSCGRIAGAVVAGLEPERLAAAVRGHGRDRGALRAAAAVEDVLADREQLEIAVGAMRRRPAAMPVTSRRCTKPTRTSTPRSTRARATVHGRRGATRCVGAWRRCPRPVRPDRTPRPLGDEHKAVMKAIRARDGAMADARDAAACCKHPTRI